MKTLKIEIPEGYEIDKDKSTFETIVFKESKKVLPKSWEEIKEIKGYRVNDNSGINSTDKAYTEYLNRNIFVTIPQAKASIALAQLSQLREVYRQGWTPNWEKLDESKYCIELFGSKQELEIDTWNRRNYFLSFQTREIAEEFLNNFQDLIEQARPLMS